MIKISEIEKKIEWNKAIRNLPGCSILQTWEWGQVKSEYGWASRHFIWKDKSGMIAAAALVLIREIRIPFSPITFCTLYIPQGPLLDWVKRELRNRVLNDIIKFAESINAFSVKIDPEVICGRDEVISQSNSEFLQANEIIEELLNGGWEYSSQQIQFKNTAWINLEKSEDEILSAMKQKSRYNIRLAEKQGVRVRCGSVDDLELLYQMYLETSLRDGFIIRPKDYYLSIWSKFINAHMAVPLIAEVDNEAIAGLILFHFGCRSWYLYGMSTDKHRKKMPNYLLQWEAIKHSKVMKCKMYDLWGAPDNFTEQDRIWGVYRFKKGLGGEVIQRIGAYDLPLRKNTYRIFVKVLPRIQSITRKMRRAQQMQELY